MSKGHTKIRNELFDDHLRKGWMDGDMYTAYNIMIRECDWGTGVWRGCAEKLVRAMGNAWSEATAKRIIQRLEWGRYITRKNKSGVHGNYDVQINNYVPTMGPNKGKKLHRTKTIFWEEGKASRSLESPNSSSPLSDPRSPLSAIAVTSERHSGSPLSGNQDVTSSQDSEPQDSSSIVGAGSRLRGENPVENPGFHDDEESV